MVRVREFEHDGRKLQISVTPEGSGWVIRLLENGKQLTPVVYGVSYETATDAAAQEYPIQLVEGLIALMKHDVINGVLPIPKEAA
jgi:hypothetical protein